MTKHPWKLHATLYSDDGDEFEIFFDPTAKELTITNIPEDQTGDCHAVLPYLNVMMTFFSALVEWHKELNQL
jgi:hypothetical protein